MSPANQPIRKGGRGPLAALIAALLVGLLLPLAAAAPARAGLLKQWVCRAPDGSLTGNIDGWASSNTIPNAQAYSNCATENGVTGLRIDANAMFDTNANQGMAWWRYKAPQGTTVNQVYLFVDGITREGDRDGASLGMTYYRGEPNYSPDYVLESCERWKGCDRELRWIHHVPNDLAWYATFGCGGPPWGVCGGGFRGGMTLSHGFVVLNDVHPPFPGSVSGSAITESTLSGNERLYFAGNDTGVGVQDVEVRIGGVAVLPRQLIDSNGGRCVPTDGGYLVQVPCRITVPGDLTIDTTKAPEGPQTLTATMWDASGNAGTIISKRVNIDNVPPPSSWQNPAVTVSGSGYFVGETATATSGQWTGANVKTALQWQRSADGETWKDIPYETKSSYRLGDGDMDSYVRVAVTGTNSDGSATAFSERGARVRQRGASVGGVPGPGGSDPNDPKGPNGSGGQLSSGRLLLTNKSGKRRASAGKTITIKGRLVDASKKAIAGAHVDVFQTPALAGAQRSKIGETVTDNNGEYAYKLRALANSRVELAYAATEDSGNYVDRQTVDLRVMATIKLKARRTLRVHTKVKIQGRLIGGPLPARGATILFKAFDSASGRFKEAGEVQTRPDGTFRYLRKLDYRGKYRFRAELVATKDVPLVKALSAHKDIVVR